MHSFAGPRESWESRTLSLLAIFGAGVLTGYFARGGNPSPDPPLHHLSAKRSTAVPIPAPPQAEAPAKPFVRTESPAAYTSDAARLTPQTDSESTEDPAELVKALRQYRSSDEYEKASERLKRYLYGGTDHVQRILTVVRSETDEAVLQCLTWYLRDLRVLKDAGLVRELRQIARDDIDGGRRAWALKVLEGVPELTSDLMVEFTQAATSNVDPRVRCLGLSSLYHFEGRRPEDVPVFKDMLRAAAWGDPDEDVRWTAIYRLDLEESPESFGVLEQFLRQDPSASVRIHVAELLSDVEPPLRQQAMTHLEAAFGDERDPKVKKALVEGVVWTGRNVAPAVLKRMLEMETDPDLRQDIEDFLDILAAGYVEEDEIDQQKENHEQRRKEPSPAGGRNTR